LIKFSQKKLLNGREVVASKFKQNKIPRFVRNKVSLLFKKKFHLRLFSIEIELDIKTLWAALAAQPTQAELPRVVKTMGPVVPMVATN